MIVYYCFSSLFGNLGKRRTLVRFFDCLRKEYIPITYWENSIGRNKHCDIVVDSPMASRNHAVFYRRDEGWFITDTNSKGGIYLNNKLIDTDEKVYINDVIKIGEFKYKLCKAEEEKNRKKQKTVKRFSNLSAMLMLLIFHLLVTAELSFSGETFNLEYFKIFGLVQAVIWTYFLVSRFLFKRANFELEILCMFLSIVGISVCSSVEISSAYTQLIAFTIGIILFNFIIFFIRNPDFAMKCRPYIAWAGIALLAANLIFGKVKNGSQNWIMIGSVSVQPSEFVKIAFVFFGASTLKSLQTTRNLTEFILFSCTCMGALFLMGDFGTACIFFVAFVIISFMRSGSIRTVFLTLVASIFGVLLILKFKPYIVNRFSAWRNVWEHVNDIGYQQTRVLAYSASGGLLGMGLGKSCLKYVFAASSDLVFGMLCEEWGMIIGFTVIITIAMLAIYTQKLSVQSRSAFYSIASCGAAGIMIFQMMMNVFGSIDILPMTGVTLPFISAGGSSLASVWGLLAFIKAADEHTYGITK